MSSADVKAPEIIAKFEILAEKSISANASCTPPGKAATEHHVRACSLAFTLTSHMHCARTLDPSNLKSTPASSHKIACLALA